MLRSLLIALVLSVPAAGAVAAQRPAEHVVLVTIDGLRPQEMFTGPDSTIMASRRASGIDDTAGFRTSYWRPTAVERRRNAMPFFWDSLVPRGVITGMPGGAVVRSTNGHKFSAPGYQEIYTGAPEVDVTSNDDRRYDHRTIFDVVRDRLATRRADVAAFVSWSVQGRLVSARPAAVVVNVANEPFPPESRVPPVAVLETVESRIHHSDGVEMRHDAITHALAIDYLARYHPRLLHIGLGETDIEAHNRRYDRLFDLLRSTDDMLRELWRTIEADPELRGRTAIVITTDHGRGETPMDWTDHGNKVAGADRIWIAAVGAGVPARGVVDVAATQSQVGPTVLALLGLSSSELGPGAATPIAAFLKR
jgi:arylsulfatase A-like enzyme